jgi:transcriptional regulator with XRE-family HTH domain
MDEQELKGILGKNIKIFRSRKQLSQADLAERADISITFLSNIERGNNYPQAGTLCNIAQALEIEVWELFRAKPSSDDHNLLVSRMSEDITRQVNHALETVYKLYIS